MARSSSDKIYGCLIGGAIGDSLGSPAEGMSHEQIRDRYGKLDEFDEHHTMYSEGHPGSITGDSVIRHYLCLAIVENEGRVTPEDVAESWRAHLNTDRVWINEEIVYMKLQAGMNPWRTGRNLVPSSGGMMGITPVGLVNAGNPSQAYQDGLNVASLNQDGINRDAAGTIAAGTAEAMTPDATVESVLETMAEYSTEIVSRAIVLGMDLAARSATTDEFVDLFYDELLDWKWPGVNWDTERYYDDEVFSSTAEEILPAVVGLMALCGDRPNRAVVEGASFGRDCDTIASLIGSIAGTLHGASSFEDRYVSSAETANRSFFDEVSGDPDADFEWMATQLEAAIESEYERTRRRADTLATVLDQ